MFKFHINRVTTFRDMVIWTRQHVTASGQLCACTMHTKRPVRRTEACYVLERCSICSWLSVRRTGVVLLRENSWQTHSETAVYFNSTVNTRSPAWPDETIFVATMITQPFTEKNLTLTSVTWSILPYLEAGYRHSTTNYKFRAMNYFTWISRPLMSRVPVVGSILSSF